MASVPFSRVGSAVVREVSERLPRAQIHLILVAQARRRMANGGDTDFRYPELWDHPGSYRQGGQPLLDTGLLAASLNGTTEERPGGLRATLQGPVHAVYHQNGFTTKGPNFIPLTLKAKRTHRRGANPRDEGLEEGKDYIMAWNGVTVPQRKIYNMPPENRAEIVESLQMAIAEG